MYKSSFVRIFYSKCFEGIVIILGCHFHICVGERDERQRHQFKLAERGAAAGAWQLRCIYVLSVVFDNCVCDIQI